MKILALEFSSAQRSVAVVDAGGGPDASLAVREVTETGARTTRALGLIADALREAHLEREQIDCLALGLGPGSYTGIRAAIAVAQGWELGSAGKTRLLGISTADCLAAQARAAGMRGRVVVVIDAQRQEFYLADYELSAEGWREVVPLRLAPRAEVQRREQAGEQLVGPEVAAWFPSAHVLLPSAAMAGLLAAARTDFVSGEALKPIYLRETTFVKAAPGKLRL